MSVVCVASGILVGSLYCWVLWKLKEVSTTRRSSILLSPAAALFHLFCTHVYCCKGNGSVTFSFISALLWTAHLQMDSLASGLHLQWDFPITSKITTFNVSKCFLLMYFVPSGQISVIQWLWGKCHFLSRRLICAYFFLKINSYFAKIESIFCFLEIWEYQKPGEKMCWDPLFYLPWRKLNHYTDSKILETKSYYLKS